MKCRMCNTNYHYCSSCGPDGYSEHGLCSPKCMEEFYNESHPEVQPILSFLKNLPCDMKEDFVKILESYDDEIGDRYILPKLVKLVYNHKDARNA